MSAEDRIAVGVRWSVRLRRMLGQKDEHAQADAAAHYGVNPRYVRSIVRGEPWRVRDRYNLMLHRWWSDMDRMAAEYRAFADEIERKREAEELAAAQLTLPLGDSGCSELASPASSSGAGDVP